jgi:hypothetical protein
MTNIEEQLRDAYYSAADTVRPDAIRGLAEQAAVIAHPARWSAPKRTPGRWLVPAAAAAAVVAIGVAAGVVGPHALSRARQPGPHSTESGTGPGDFGERFVVGEYYSTGAFLTVHNSRTGATVATIEPPGRDNYFGQVATGNGRQYIAVVISAKRGGRTRLVSFSLNASGRPTSPTALPGGPAGVFIGQVAVSADGRTIAFYAQRTSVTRGPIAAELGVVDVATGKTRRWLVSSQDIVGSLSLSADGRLLEYEIQSPSTAPSAVYLLPTDAAAGRALRRSNEIVTAASFGRHADIASALITNDGLASYFSTNEDRDSWQLRAVNLASGRVRLVGSYPALPQYFTADPAQHQLLVSVVPDRSGAARLERVALPSGALSALSRRGWQPGKFWYFW